MNPEEDGSRIGALASLIEEEWRSDVSDELASRLTNRGGILSNQGRLNEAMADLEKAVELFGRLVNEEGQGELAFKLALAFTNRGITLCKLGRVREGIGDLDQAIPIYEKSVEQDGRTDLSNALSMARRNREIAIEHLKGRPMTAQPMYDSEAVRPMREELTRVGIRDLLTPEDVDGVFSEKKGTALLVVNSVCGCAAGGARPGVMLALQNKLIPDQLTTVFAGMERDAVERARSYLKGCPPSSPCVALFKDGEAVAILQRHDIEGRSPVEIAQSLSAAFDRFCSRPGPSIPREELEKIIPHQACGSEIPRFEQ